jgi:hypothetical protein
VGHALLAGMVSSKPRMDTPLRRASPATPSYEGTGSTIHGHISTSRIGSPDPLGITSLAPQEVMGQENSLVSGSRS